MRLSSKLIRRIFLFLSPLLLTTTMVQCFLLEELFFILCQIDPPLGFIQNATGFNLQNKKVFVGNGGEIYIGEGIFSCEYSD